MTYKEALEFDQKWTPEQARNDLERYLLRDEPPAYKAVALAMQALEMQYMKKGIDLSSEDDRTETAVLIFNARPKTLRSVRNGVIAVDTKDSVYVKVGDPVFIAGGKYRSGSIEYWINTGGFRLTDVGKLGDTVFLSREEAEQRITEWKEKKFDPTYDRGW